MHVTYTGCLYIHVCAYPIVLVREYTLVTYLELPWYPVYFCCVIILLFLPLPAHAFTIASTLLP